MKKVFFGQDKRDRISQLLGQGHVSAALSMWAQDAEKWTASLAGMSERDTKKHLGRSQLVRFREAPATAEIQRGKRAQGETSEKLVLFCEVGETGCGT